MRELKPEDCIAHIPAKVGFHYVDYTVMHGYYMECAAKVITGILRIGVDNIPVYDILDSWQADEKGPEKYKDWPIFCTAFQVLPYPEFEDEDV